MIEQTLSERKERYGDFKTNALIIQNLKAAMKDSPNWNDLPPEMKEALEMTMHKVGRILNGDPYYLDNWHDAIGYLTLIEKDL